MGFIEAMMGAFMLGLVIAAFLVPIALVIFLVSYLADKVGL